MEQQIEVRLNDNVVKFLRAKTEEDFVERINAATIRYSNIIMNECPSLTYSEWMCIIDVLNSTSLFSIKDGNPDIVNNLPTEIAEANAFDKIGKKWNIDAIALADQLYYYSYAQKCAIVEVVNSWWSSERRPSDKDSIMKLIDECGGQMKK